MNPTALRAKLAKGEACFGLMAFEFFTPGLPQVLAAAGAEYLIIDMEHSGIGIDTVKQQIAAARGLDIAPWVRVPGSHYHLIATILDAGAWGIMAPLVETQEQAQNIADWCRYRPVGKRGLAFNMSHDDYLPGDIVAKMKAENKRTTVIALIESVKGIANADAILGVKGVDIGWLGHYDLSDSMGIPGQFDHPDFVAAVDKLVAAANKHKKPLGFMDGNLELVETMIARGFRVIGFGTDISLLQSAFRQGLARLKGKR
ncbi:MAG: aldolase/citrate lyase family protein [Gammaproteobacteria bacterium]